MNTQSKQGIEYDLIGIPLSGSGNGTLEKVFSLNADNFSKEYREIFKAEKTLYREGESLDVFKVTSKLKERCKPKLLDSCLNVLAKIPTQRDRFEFQLSNIDNLINSLKNHGASDRNIIIAHPAYEVNCNFLSLGFRETIIEDDAPKDRNFYIISHDDTFTLSDSNIFQHKGRKIIFDERERLLVRHQDRWHKDLIQTFIDNPVSPKKLYEEIKEVLCRYLELPKEEMYGLLSAWIIATYFYQIFYSMLFLFIYGKKGCGKSRLLTIMERLCFNALKVKGVSVASLADSIDGVRGTFLNDQAEALSNDKNIEILGLLTDSYTRGGGTRRIVNMSNKKRSVMDFETYSPKAFASIKEIDSDLRDRCVEITMLRATKDFPEPEAFLPIWSDIRDKLHRLLLTRWKDAREIFQTTGEGVSHRVRELWRPIETILKLENVSDVEIQNIKGVFLESMQITQAELSDHEYELFSVLLEMLEQQENKKGIFTVGEIAEKLSKEEGIKDKAIQIWVGRMLRQFSLYDYPCGRKNGNKRQYFFSYDHVKNIFERYKSC